VFPFLHAHSIKAVLFFPEHLFLVQPKISNNLAARIVLCAVIVALQDILLRSATAFTVFL
jgi:hypothetical protein